MTGEKTRDAGTLNGLHWRVDVTDEQGKPLTIAAFYIRGDAEEFAARLNEAELVGLRAWNATVEEIA